MLLWMEGFDAFSTVESTTVKPLVVARGYTVGTSSTSYYTVYNGHWGGMALSLGNRADAWFQTPALTTDSTIIVGASVKFSVRDSLYNLIEFWSGSGLGIHLRVETETGDIRLYRDGTLLETFAASLATDTWYYIEVKVYVHDTTGTVEIRINRQVVATFTGDTDADSTGYYNAVRFRDIATTGTTSWDDIYICDGTTALNNDFLGVHRVVTVLPDGAGDSTTWTPSTGDNYDCVNDTAPSLTDYVETETLDNIDLYAYAAISGISGSITALQLNTFAFSETDSVAWTLQDVCKSGATVSTGSSQAVSAGSGEYINRLLLTDPATDAAWIQSGINSAQFGVKLIALS